MFIKKYNQFVESLKFDLSILHIDMNESLSIWYESLLKSIGAEEVDIFDEFKLPKDDYIDKLDIEYLSDNIEFVNSLSSIGLKKSQIQKTDDLETFISKSCRFMFIYNVESNELEDPKFLLIQSWNNTLNKWEDSKLYKINGNIDKFYDKLSSKVIEIDDNGEKYIYQTSNNNEWNLQNSDKESKKFKKYFRKDEFEEFINKNEFKIKVI